MEEQDATSRKTATGHEGEREGEGEKVEETRNDEKGDNETKRQDIGKSEVNT